jgi:glutamine amidotransferase
VRASTEGELSEPNCHPFWCGALIWMHNGGIGAWKQVKRALALSLAPKWFNFVRGGTDSEWAFALFLDCLEKRGCDPLDAEMPEGGFGHVVLRKAMEDTIARINALIAEIPAEERQKSGFDARSLMNFAVTDGHSVVCTRYVNSRTDEAASLFWSSGTCWRELGEAPDGKKHFRMERKDKGSDIVLVASEPLTYDRSTSLRFSNSRDLNLTGITDSWVIVPTNSILTISKQTVTIHPIKDEFYSHDPSEERSLKFAQTKGQTVTNSQKEVITGNIDQDSPKQQIQLNLAA